MFGGGERSSRLVQREQGSMFPNISLTFPNVSEGRGPTLGLGMCLGTWNRKKEATRAVGRSEPVRKEHFQEASDERTTEHPLPARRLHQLRLASLAYLP